MATITTAYTAPTTLNPLTITIQFSLTEAQALLSDLPEALGNNGQKLYPNTYALYQAILAASQLTATAPSGGGSATPTVTTFTL